MKKTMKTAVLLAAAAMAALAFFGCKTNSGGTGETPDTTAPANVTELNAEAKDSRVLLTWKDAQDSDIFGYEVSYDKADKIINRAVASMEKSTIFVAQGNGGTYISGLENGTEYTFIVKSMDTSGNKSDGVQVKATPVAADASSPLEITLSSEVPHENGYTGSKSKTYVDIIADITSASSAKRVAAKKNGSVNAKTLLSDTSVTEGSKLEDGKWRIRINAENESANGSYTVAALDEAGREETAQISITSFDFTPPERVIAESSYSETNKTVTLSWKEPSAADFVKVKITFVTNDGTSDSEPIEPVYVEKGTSSITFEDIDDKKEYYKYSIVSIDELGNECVARDVTINLGHSIDVPAGFCIVGGVTIEGNETWNPTSNRLFIKGRKLQIPALFVCDHEVTRGEYKDVTGTDPSTSVAYDRTGKQLEGDAALDNPVTAVSWLDAIIYCNKRSINEGLKPCYSYTGKDGNPTTDPDQWEIKHDSSETSNLNANMKCDFNANGYRLPTEIEWEWSARGGQNYKYAGSDTLGDVAWCEDNSKYDETREVKAKNPNGYGLYDMSGNVFEWGWDLFDTITTSTPESGPDPSAEGLSDKYERIWRGGACGYAASLSYFNVNYRRSTQWYSRSKATGFRVVRNAN